MKCADRKYLLKEAQRTLDESDSTAAFCLCQRWILKDAIALMKEQEAVDIVWKCGFPHCSACGQMIPEGSAVKYCLQCGQAVKWE